MKASKFYCYEAEKLTIKFLFYVSCGKGFDMAFSFISASCL